MAGLTARWLAEVFIISHLTCYFQLKAWRLLIYPGGADGNPVVGRRALKWLPRLFQMVTFFGKGEMLWQFRTLVRRL